MVNSHSDEKSYDAPTDIHALNSSDDVAAQYVQGDEDIDPAVERRLLWKIDLILMPLLTVSYGLQYYDKAVFSSAAIFGLLEDLDLSVRKPNGTVSTERFATASSAFYWGYIVACYPMSYFLQKYPLGRTLSLCIFLWGVITLLTIVCHNYQGIVAQRVFLGAIESAVSPGFVLVSGIWYKREEQPSRIGIWYAATGLFSIFSGAVNYGIGKAAQGTTLSAWKYLYIFAGSATILWSILTFFFLPDNPTTARWLTPEERKVAIRRLAQNQTGTESKRWKQYQVIEGVFDVKIMSFFLMGTAIYMVNGGVTAFGSQIVKSFGYSSLKTTLMQTPCGATTAVSIWISGWIAGRWKNSRTLLIPITCVPVIIGAAIIWKGSWQHRGLPLFGFYLLGIFGAPYVLLLSLSTANIGGHTKKAFSAAAIFIGYNIGNIASPYLVDTTTRAQHYPKVWISIIVVMAFTSVLSIVLRFYLAHENAQRDRAQQGHGEKRSTINSFSDLTDKENMAFRYSY